jgi:hypothetical protein
VKCTSNGKGVLFLLRLASPNIEPLLCKFVRYPLQNSSQPNPQLEQDILALQQIRAKLVKSKDLAWRAHQLQHQNDEHSRARQRVIGLSLCVFSVIGAGLLVYLALQQ